MTATTIQVKGDSNDAQQAFKALGADIDRTSRKLREMAREAASVGFGVLGAGTIEEALTAAYDAARDALDGYIERNREAAEVVEGTRHALREMTDTFDESALGGGNLESILGSVQLIARELTGSFLDNRDAIQASVREGWINLLEVVPTVIATFNGFRAVIDGAKLAFMGLQLGIRTGITAILDIGRAIHQGLLVVIRELSEGVRTIISDMAQLAAAVDSRLGTNLAQPFRDAAHGLNEWNQGLDEGVERLEAIGAANRAYIQNELVAFTEASADIVRGIEDRENARQNLAASIADFADRIRSGEIAEMALRRSVSDGTDSIEDQAEAFGELTEALRGYATEWFGWHERYKQGLNEQAAAERELNDFVMSRYEAQQAKIIELAEARAAAEEAQQSKFIELAEARAAAEEGALLKVQDAADRGLAIYQDYFSGVSDGLAEAIVENARYVKALKEGAAEILSALADEAAVRASIAFASGNIAGGTAFAAAAAAAKLAAAKLSAKRDTSSAGAGGGAASGPTNITNVTVNAGVVSDRAGLVREISDFVNEGQRQGLIA